MCGRLDRGVALILPRLANHGPVAHSRRTGLPGAPSKPSLTANQGGDGNIKRVAFGAVGLILLAGAVAPARAAGPPRTEFEGSEGASWTPHESEVAFLLEVDAASKRVEME